MDTSKDNIEQTKSTGLTSPAKNADILSFFDNDQSFDFVYKKTEKLTTAVYMVTNIFSENEPMKWTIRKKVSDLLSFTITYKDVTISVHDSFVSLMKMRVMEIVSMLQVASLSGLVSQMNFSIIRQEFVNLISFLESAESTKKETSYNSLSDAFFNVDIGHKEVTGFPNNSYQPAQELPKTSGNFVKDKSQELEANGFKKTNRQNIILGLLKKKKDLTIKDISHIIKDCSEKTIQRELITLISLGVLKKTGERRWSKYSLK